jgi:uncharacterized heparinase superfamily protein
VRFLRTLWLHAEFTARNLERATVNGNHLDADAAGLVFAGLFFPGARATQWADIGWRILEAELPRQVTADGVDFEMSSAYQRLVLELFLFPALYRVCQGLSVAVAYRERLATMARFAATYTRPDGSSPAWGDADDGRALPLGGQSLGDHRYLAGLVGLGLDRPDALAAAAGPRSEAAWVLGPDVAARLPTRADPGLGTTGFEQGGIYVMRGRRDHVFVDCGPVGLAGLGGHGHNDCLSLEASLDGVHLLTDCGSYVYTASMEERDRFRSTAYHNTPQVDGLEQNRFTGSPWTLANDADPSVHRWSPGEHVDLLEASHTGFARRSAVTPVRTIVLDRALHALALRDVFVGSGTHAFRVPFHVAPGIDLVKMTEGQWLLQAPTATFALSFADSGQWEAVLEEGWCSPSYGVRSPIQRLVLTRSGRAAPLLVAIGPATAGDLLDWATQALDA